MKNDLLIIDIDDTFIYHRTVAIANKLFLETLYSLFNKKLPDDMYTTKKSMFLIIKLFLLFYRFDPSIEKIKRLVKLTKTALHLHLLKVLREINNRFFNIISNEQIIRIWAGTVVSLNIKTKEYQLSEKAIKNNLNKDILKIYNSLKKSNPKVIAISQNFAADKDPIKEILDIDAIESNEFISKDGYISGYKLNVKNKEDKKRRANKYKGKNIGIFIEDYDDTALLTLKNLKFALYKKKLKKFIKNKKITSIPF